MPRCSRCSNSSPRTCPSTFPSISRCRWRGSTTGWSEASSGTLYLLLGAVALLLAIGCGNVSILLLAQGTARQHEFAVRAAVGAHSRRIVRQLLTESLLLAAIGVALGVLASYGILAGIKLVLPRFAFAPEVVIRINLPVLVFSGAVALATALLFGLWPALQLSRTQVGQIMVSNARRVAGSVRGRRTHNALIAGQIALTLVLLAGAGSAMESFLTTDAHAAGLRSAQRDVGRDPAARELLHHLGRARSIFRTTARQGGGNARRHHGRDLQQRHSAAEWLACALRDSGHSPPRRSRRRPSTWSSPEYFAALRIPLLEGRMWNETENHNGAHRGGDQSHPRAALLSEWRCHRPLRKAAGLRRPPAGDRLGAKDRRLRGCRSSALSRMPGTTACPTRSSRRFSCRTR